MSHSLNIVSFDIPFPANYGGVIDVYYKLFWLKKAGVKIHLHCFMYGRQPAHELETLCEKVYYYPRKTGIGSNLSLLPYTVKSRQSKQLEENLLSNDFPILFEVLHTCYLLNDERFAHRKKIYRHSNIEHNYYNELAKTERGFIKRNFLKLEALRLKRFERILHKANLILTVNEKDTTYFRENYPEVPSEYLPSFHVHETVSAMPGRSNYLLFHGNLSISENYEAAEWLVKNVFSKLETKVLIAGLNPPAFLKDLCEKHGNIELIANPPSSEMTELIANAQAHILYTAQATGLKLKLLNVLFSGRFVICNAHMLSGTGLMANSSLLVAENANDFIVHIEKVLNLEYTPTYINERTEQVKRFDNVQNAGKLIKWVF
ncbi:MAG: glycosyltransferase [Bacteroidia bacterium]|nr:glycosyltransferase [Bacteroidia bacterium]